MPNSVLIRIFCSEDRIINSNCHCWKEGFKFCILVDIWLIWNVWSVQLCRLVSYYQVWFVRHIAVMAAKILFLPSEIHKRFLTLFSPPAKTMKHFFYNNVQEGTPSLSFYIFFVTIVKLMILSRFQTVVRHSCRVEVHPHTTPPG